MAKAIRNKLEGVVEELTTVLALPDIDIPNRSTDEEPSNVAQFENTVRLLTVREQEILGIATQTEELEAKLLGLATTDEQDAEHTQYANRIRLKAKQRDARTKIRELRGVISATMRLETGKWRKWKKQETIVGP